MNRHFPGATYHSAYEASFCGFTIHRRLKELEINNFVFNPADVPTTDKEKKQKEDSRDSHKLAMTLRSGDLEGIYVPSLEMEELRSLVRYRKTLVKDIAMGKNRIKSNLYFHDKAIASEHQKAAKYWSNNFTQWLQGVTYSTEYGTMVLQNLIDTTLQLRNRLLKATRAIRAGSRSSKYSGFHKLLTSITSIATIKAMTIISELETIERFQNLDKLCSYIGLVPTTSYSGEKEKTGNVTPRANRILHNAIIESAWMAARIAPALSLAYNKLRDRMNANKAIIRIAKKLLNRIRYVLKKDTEYVYSVMS